jgi:hypothetical protein
MLILEAQFALNVDWHDHSGQDVQHFTIKFDDERSCNQWAEQLSLQLPVTNLSEEAPLDEEQIRPYATASYWVSPRL